MSGLLAQAYPESATSRITNSCSVSFCRFPAYTVAGPQGLVPLSLGMDNLILRSCPTFCQELAWLTTTGLYITIRPMMYNQIEIYTDGGCLGNPGPGGWAYVLKADGAFEKESSGSERDTTNNRMELTAVIEALKACRPLGAKAIVINTDSQYVKNGITSWIKKWKVNGWRTAAKDPVKNKEYWVELDRLNASLPVQWNWVKGHAGIEGNERCDQLVRQAMDALV